VLEDVERRRIQPLQIVKKQARGVSFRAKTRRKRRKTIWKRFFASCDGQVRDRRLSSDHELQLGNEVHDELTVRAPSASLRASRHRSSSASFWPKIGRTRL